MWWQSVTNATLINVKSPVVVLSIYKVVIWLSHYIFLLLKITHKNTFLIHNNDCWVHITSGSILHFIIFYVKNSYYIYLFHSNIPHYLLITLTLTELLFCNRGEVLIPETIFVLPVSAPNVAVFIDHQEAEVVEGERLPCDVTSLIHSWSSAK